MSLSTPTSRRLAIAIATLALATAAAGCLGSEETPTSDAEDPDGGENATEALEAMTATGETHDHANPAQHDVAHQAELLDHLSFVEEGKASGTHALGLAGDTLYVASTLQGDHGFYSVDVSNPSDMQVIGEWHDEAAKGGDRALATTEEGDWVVLGTEGNETDEEAGVRLFDTSDPTSPEQVAFQTFESGAHTVDTMRIDGEVYVFALNYGVQILQVVDGATGPELVKVGHYAYTGPEMSDTPEYDNPGNYPSWGLRSAYAHDMKPVDDPERGPLLYVAYAYQGMHVLDVNDPTAPELVTRWTPGGDASPWYTHSIDAGFVDGQRAIVVGSEVFEDRHVEEPSPVWILDGSDLENPEVVSTWTNPAGTGSQNLLFSAHFFRVDDSRVHLSHYHGGSWVIDISSPADPTTESAYLPHEDTGFRPGTECCFGFNLAGIPVTMDAVGDDEVTYAADVQTGLYAIENTAYDG
jgi:hypothetical protein